ncbi:MAG: hypothetical protein R3F59_16200 [Myxococcota bacterium]
MLDGAIKCSACGETIPASTRLQDDGTHICPACGERVDALPRFLGAGRGAPQGERTDDPITMPAIPASAFEPAVPVAFTGKHRWKPRKGAPTFDDDEPGPFAATSSLDPEPTPAYERVSHEIEAPAPPPLLRAEALPDDAVEVLPEEPPPEPIPEEEAPTVRPARRRAEPVELARHASGRRAEAAARAAPGPAAAARDAPPPLTATPGPVPKASPKATLKPAAPKPRPARAPTPPPRRAARQPRRTTAATRSSSWSRTAC